jgi:hypothetical protein
LPERNFRQGGEEVGVGTLRTSFLPLLNKIKGENVTQDKVKTIAELMPTEEEAEDSKGLVAKLIDSSGKLICDTTMPPEYQLEIMAELLLDHLTSYQQTRQAWRAAKNSGDHQKGTQLFQQMNYNQLTAAIIQAEYPAAKAITDNIAKARIKELTAKRLAAEA